MLLSNTSTASKHGFIIKKNELPSNKLTILKMTSERRQQSNFLNPDVNPCIEESLLSQKCLDEKLYDYEECALYFENYKQCKRFWGMIRQKRRAAGIKPPLPVKAERDEILKLRKEGKNVISVDETK